MLSKIFANFNILWIFECISYKCNVQGQESLELPSLFLENQLGHLCGINAPTRLVGASPTVTNHLGSCENEDSDSVHLWWGRDDVYLTNSYVMLMPPVLKK